MEREGSEKENSPSDEIGEDEAQQPQQQPLQTQLPIHSQLRDIKEEVGEEEKAFSRMSLDEKKSPSHSLLSPGEKKKLLSPAAKSGISMISPSDPKSPFSKPSPFPSHLRGRIRHSIDVRALPSYLGKKRMSTFGQFLTGNTNLLSNALDCLIEM